jgi:hypothetical protein
MAETIEISVGEPVAVELGELRFQVRRREVGSDGGVSIELYAQQASEPEELIRFDLFRDDPHYHVPATNPKPRRIDPASDGDPLEFALAGIRSLPELLKEAGHPARATAADALDLADAAERVRAAVAGAPEPSETRSFDLTPELRKLLGQE